MTDTTGHPVVVSIGDPMADDVLRLLEGHLADMRATSPPESVHALDGDALVHPAITFWTAREGPMLLGCGALKELNDMHGEIKSMRTAPEARRRGIATLLLSRILDEARTREYSRLSLETGSQDFFIPARSLYAAHGFVECGPFGDYRLDPNSVFMTRRSSAKGHSSTNVDVTMPIHAP